MYTLFAGVNYVDHDINLEEIKVEGLEGVMKEVGSAIVNHPGATSFTFTVTVNQED